MKRFAIIILICLMALTVLVGCTTVSRQQGGDGRISGNFGGANVEQAENASESAKVDYNEAGVKIPMKKNDELNVTVEKKSSGESKTKIKFTPQNDSTVEVTDIKGNISTGASHEDIVGQLQVFMENAKLIMWVGVGFLVAGGLFAGFLRDVRSGIILGGIGAVMLVGYAILPQLYANYIIVLGIASIAIPVIWWLNYKKNQRLLIASQKSYERIKQKHPEIAKEQSDEFKKHINPKDIDHARKIRKSHS